MNAGDSVGASRWPYGGSRYSPPHRGTLLALDDPRAWLGSHAFPDGAPTRAAVRAHIAAVRARDARLLDGTHVPVLWHFPSGDVVHWERADMVRAYEADVAAWRAHVEPCACCGASA